MKRLSHGTPRRSHRGFFFSKSSGPSRPLAAAVSQREGPCASSRPRGTHPHTPTGCVQETVTGWLDDPELVEPSLSLWRRTELYLSLRMLHGLDLPDFLRGARVAYPVVTTAMYRRDWEALQSLVAPNCLEVRTISLKCTGATQG